LKRELGRTHYSDAQCRHPLRDAIRQFKKRYILEVLAHHKGNQCKAAEELGMHANTLSRTLAELDMDTAQIRNGMRRHPAASATRSKHRQRPLASSSV